MNQYSSKLLGTSPALISIRWGLSILLLVAFFSGCANRRNTQPTEDELYYSHTISYSGETLGTIANWYTGSTRNWKVIANANPGLRPSALRLGSTVKIPRVILTRTDPMPQRAVGRPRTASVEDASDGSAQKSTNSESTDVVASKGEADSAIEEMEELEPMDSDSNNKKPGSDSDQATEQPSVVTPPKGVDQAIIMKQESDRAAQEAAAKVAAEAAQAAAEQEAARQEAARIANAKAQEAAETIAKSNDAASLQVNKSKTREELLKELLDEK